jgi:hypothetical protein
MATDTLGNTVIIDLGLDRGEPETYRRPTRGTVPRWFGPLVIAVLVLVVSAASAAPAPPVLTEVLNVRVNPADSYAVSDTGRLLAQTFGTLTSYDLAGGRLQWTVGTVAPTYRLRTGSGVVLLRPWAIGPGEPRTTAVDLRTGAVRWSHEGSVITLPGSSVLLAVTGIRTLSTAGRRVQGPIESIDPLTGRALWRVDVPSTAVLIGVPGPPESLPRMLLVHDDRTFVLHDLSTGAVLSRTVVPPADYGPENPSVSGGLVLLRHPVGWGADISAYDPVTLAVRWRRPAAGAYQAQPCGPLACLTGPDGVIALDPANGAIRWYHPGWHDLELRGRTLIAYASPGGITDAVGVVDPYTGDVLVDLRGWRPLTSTGTGDDVFVARPAEQGARSIVAVARPGDRQLRLITDMPTGTGDCQAVPKQLICRSTSGDLILWGYRLKG